MAKKTTKELSTKDKHISAYDDEWDAVDTRAKEKGITRSMVLQRIIRSYFGLDRKLNGRMK